MKKAVLLIGMSLMILITFCSCTIKSDKKMSQKELDSMKAEYEEYLKGKYPNETFTVKLWEEYGYDVGGAGLPDYEGYLFHSVITDSRGNHFKIFETGTLKEKYTDDYQEVLNGTIKYDDKGERIYE
ncbi:MAG: hypothetical protein K6E28_01065 [Eubacterium sp.]|nr:hypothetical protein [Eubacterium sp.]